jgi:hypothetical protein
MRELVKKVLKKIGPGTMSEVAYDTAWVALLKEIDPALSNNALNWLSSHQLKDGSWGMEKPFDYHDRVINTLAAMVALTKYGQRLQDQAQIKRGLIALEKITDKAFQEKMIDASRATAAFEMLTPVLIEEAEKLGLIPRQRETILGQLANYRRKKLELLNGRKISRHLSAAFSAEMAGFDHGMDMLDLEQLQESNGSIGHSPSATAYYILNFKPDDAAALSYLHKFASPNGGALDLAPFEIFEACWVLWNLSLPGEKWDDETNQLIRKWLDFIKAGWKQGKGIGLSTGYSVPDGDDTSFAFSVLARFGEPLDMDTILAYEEKEHFRTFHYELNSSNSVNIHMLDALREGGMSAESAPVQKILKHLQKVRTEDTYWYDKWHISPYYTTSHAVITCAGYANHVIEPAVTWILNTQRNDGSWGYQFSSAEETAYCLQALFTWKKHGGDVPIDVLKNATEWLKDHDTPPYPPLWLGKGLFSADVIVQSAIISALMLAEKNDL